jgi:esterase/lipase superfamily enzyme
LHREYFSWVSPRLGMEMPVMRYGHWGQALIIFPTWMSDFREAESKGLIDAIAHHIEAGKVTVYCVNSISPHAWCNDAVPVEEKVRRQAAYDGYLEEELVPHIRGILGDPEARIAATGASFGAFFAANAVFRRPDLFSCLIGMSGFYSLEHLLHGYSSEEAYFNNPSWFVPNLDGERLELLRTATELHLLTGRGAHEAPQMTERFAEILRQKEIPAWVDDWGPQWPHEWVTWRRMLEIVLRERVRF